MGLDIVELVLAIEDGFQIAITDEEASGASTVGDLCEIVPSKFDGVDTHRCLTSAAFYRVRRAITETLGVERRKVRPSTRLDDVLPKENRRESWQVLERAIKLKLPNLGLPPGTLSSFMIAGVALTVGPALYFRAGPPALGLLFVSGLAMGLILARLTPRLAVAFLNGDVTVGDLAKDVMTMNAAEFAALAGGLNRKEVWDSLCRININQTGVDRKEIYPEARIVADLGID